MYGENKTMRFGKAKAVESGENPEKIPARHGLIPEILCQKR